MASTGRALTDKVPRRAVAYGMEDSIQATCVIDGLFHPEYVFVIPTAKICDPVRFIGRPLLLVLLRVREYEHQGVCRSRRESEGIWFVDGKYVGKDKGFGNAETMDDFGEDVWMGFEGVEAFSVQYWVIRVFCVRILLRSRHAECRWRRAYAYA